MCPGDPDDLRDGFREHSSDKKDSTALIKSTALEEMMGERDRINQEKKVIKEKEKNIKLVEEYLKRKMPHLLQRNLDDEINSMGENEFNDILRRAKQKEKVFLYCAAGAFLLIMGIMARISWSDFNENNRRHNTSEYTPKSIDTVDKDYIIDGGYIHRRLKELD